MGSHATVAAPPLVVSHPTEPGWYFYVLQGSGALRLQQAGYRKGELCVFNDGWVPVKKMLRTWWGPISEPPDWKDYVLT